MTIRCSCKSVYLNTSVFKFRRTPVLCSVKKEMAVPAFTLSITHAPYPSFCQQKVLGMPRGTACVKGILALSWRTGGLPLICNSQVPNQRQHRWNPPCAVPDPFLSDAFTGGFSTATELPTATGGMGYSSSSDTRGLPGASPDRLGLAPQPFAAFHRSRAWLTGQARGAGARPPHS